MKIDTLNERIANAITKIEKKEKTIAKKTALIEKKSNEWEIEWLKDDIARLNDEIKETKASLAKYQKQLAGELEKESILTKEIPDSMKRMQTELVTTWDAYDIKYRDQIKNDRHNMEYDDFCKKYSAADRYDTMYKSNEQIHDDNVKDSRTMIINLYNRVKAITGEVTDWNDLKCEKGNIGAVLTGFVIGKEGRAEVETILAGGYNIQRLHVRTLVHER